MKKYIQALLHDIRFRIITLCYNSTSSILMAVGSSSSLGCKELFKGFRRVEDLIAMTDEALGSS